MRIIIFSVFLSILLCGCTKGGGEIEPTPYLDLSRSRGVYVGCEGNFMYGNASLSYYDRDTKETFNQIFFNTNNFPVGDVLQSTKVRGDKLYMMINNSGKIYIVDKNTMVYSNKISGLVSPRYIEFIDDTKAYITDLYSPSIAVLDLATMNVKGGILIGFSPTGLPRGTEEMIRYKNSIFTSSWSFGDKLYKIDIQTDKVVDSLTVTRQPNSIVLDKNNKLWVLSDGSYSGSPMGKVRATLTRVDADSFKTEMVFEFNSDIATPSRLRTNAAHDRLYFVYGAVRIGDFVLQDDYGIYAMGVEDAALPSQPFIKADKRLIYALGVDPYTGDIYVGDAINYVQKGIIYRYSSSGVQLDKFQVGIIPGSFAFKE